MRTKIVQLLNGGFQFNPAQWAASAARHGSWSLAAIFRKFDTSGDGYLSMGELKRAFRAIGLQKRSGEKVELDEATFHAMDTDGNGKIDVRPPARADRTPRQAWALSAPGPTAHLAKPGL